MEWNRHGARPRGHAGVHRPTRRLRRSTAHRHSADVTAPAAEVVIVGAGSAGCTLARRLVDRGTRTLLLEAGPADVHPAIHEPTRFLELW
ncbi:MAG TPA: lycopene cyclase family protein, partial [Ilumatobacteraceae bacterium]